MSFDKNPTVSIVCTVYNKEKWIGQAIDSFLSQKDVDFEILLIDDASTDASRDIIQKYAEQYPDIIRTLYNDHNLGIAETWHRACLATKGDYIARCDGDDYWIDECKLAKQLAFLEKNPESKWCGTDIDFVDVDGKTVEHNVFTRQIVDLSDSYEKMIATRGFTAPSTWLIQRDVMLLVNDMLKDDMRTADDTFNLQLDLFNHTQFCFLPEVTVAYRVNQGSDSRPNSKEKLDKRFDSLLRTQLAYLDKYPNTNYKKVLRILLERHNNFEKELSQRDFRHSNVNSQKVTIYYSNQENVFTQEQTLEFQLQYQDTISFEVPEETVALRVDLSELPSFYQYVTLVAKDYRTEVLPSSTNGTVLKQSIMFGHPDPQICYDISILDSTAFELSYKMFNVDHINQNDYIANVLTQEMLKLEKQVQTLQEYKFKFRQANDKKRYYKHELERMVVAYNSVTHSRRWIIPTAIINFFRRKR